MFQQMMRTRLILAAEVALQVDFRVMISRSYWWLPCKDQWPVQPTIQAVYETEQEVKIIKELQKNDNVISS